MSFIKKLRQKPERVRVRILFTVIVLCVPLIFIFWFASFSFYKSAPSSGETTPGFISDVTGMFHSVFSADSLLKPQTPAQPWAATSQ